MSRSGRSPDTAKGHVPQLWRPLPTQSYTFYWPPHYGTIIPAAEDFQKIISGSGYSVWFMLADHKPEHEQTLKHRKDAATLQHTEESSALLRRAGLTPWWTCAISQTAPTQTLLLSWLTHLAWCSSSSLKSPKHVNVNRRRSSCEGWWSENHRKGKSRPHSMTRNPHVFPNPANTGLSSHFHSSWFIRAEPQTAAGTGFRPGLATLKDQNWNKAPV